ncbi:hypothetical protein [Sphingobacterium siyangense]|jgi:hypothetical protein|uniref:hypothetical protein n=1 Tax=Sphingobacterium siyangense TaxID=459529 RepID=UPI0028AD570A|nr:hypothetical protein [Sphingobacterium siyangense]
MKKNIFNCLIIVGALSLFSSCDKTEGALYSGEANKVSFLNKTMKFNMEGGSISVPVGRTSTSGELSVPVTLSATGVGYTDIFKLAGPVQFANGAGESYAKVNYGDLSKIDPSSLAITPVGKDATVGLAFPISLTIPDDNVSVSKINKVDLTATSILEFEDKGNVVMNSTKGWAESSLNVKIQKAKVTSVYKIISPFGENSLAFMIKADGKTVVFPNQVLGNDPTYGPVTMSNVTGTASNGVVTLNVGAYQVSAGSFGSGVEIINLPK